MERFCFENYKALACAVADMYTELTEIDEYASVGIIAKYNDAKEMLKELVLLDYNIYDIELENPEMDGYEDEYYLSLDSEGLWCSKAKPYGTYIFDTCTSCLVFDDCSSSILKFMECDVMTEVHIGECDCEDLHIGVDEDCKNCAFKDECRELEWAELKSEEESTHNEDGLPGFSITKSDGKPTTSISFYSTDKELVKIMAEFYK